MANNKSAEKRIRQNERRRDRNRSYRSRMRTTIKKLRAAIESGDADNARGLLASTVSIIDKTAQKGVIHANTAARFKSRLTKQVDALAS
ncbi:MAG: 30S ribosomal protein S20 [Acidobacteriota bacterium]